MVILVPPPRRAVRVALLLAVSAVSHPVAAAGRPAPEAGGPQVHETRLDNGVRVLVVPRPGALAVAAGWAVEAGSAHDPASAPGLAHLLEHLLFQGTSRVGTRDPEREGRLIEREESLRSRLREAWRRGGDPSSPFDADRVAEGLGLTGELERVRAEAASVAIQGELALLYSRASAGALEARTFEDLALFTVVLPPEALELWFWLESDRLSDPVFRQLDRELRVVAEERRRDLADAKDLVLEEAVRRALWGDHPYGRPVAGPPEALALLSRDEVRGHFEDRYRPSRLTLALVGAVDPSAAVSLARRYFGRLVPRADGIEDPGAPEAGGDPDGRRIAVECEDRPRLAVAYRAVPFAHPDRPSLDLLTAILNGRTGRLHRELVLEHGAAWSAYALHRPLARAGELWFRAELRPGQDPESVLPLWDALVEDLRREPVGKEELARALEHLRTDTYRGLRESRGLLSRILIYDALGSWSAAIRPEDAWIEVTPESIRSVAREVLDEDRRRVGTCAPPRGRS